MAWVFICSYQRRLLLSYLPDCQRADLEIWGKLADSSDIMNLCLLWTIRFTFPAVSSVAADFLPSLLTSWISVHPSLDCIILITVVTHKIAAVTITHPTMNFVCFVSFSKEKVNYSVLFTLGGHLDLLDMFTFLLLSKYWLKELCLLVGTEEKCPAYLHSMSLVVSSMDFSEVVKKCMVVYICLNLCILLLSDYWL